MKKVLLSIVFLASIAAAKAQVNKGQWLLGGNVSFESSKNSKDDESKTTTFNLSPNVGYFFINNLAGGLRVSLENTKYEYADNASTMFSLSPFVRYYFLPAKQKVNVFADGSYGFGSTGSNDKKSFNQYSIMAGPALFLTPNTALEFALGYKSLGGEAVGFNVDDNDRYNTIGFNIGFQVHLGGTKK